MVGRGLISRSFAVAAPGSEFRVPGSEFRPGSLSVSSSVVNAASLAHPSSDARNISTLTGRDHEFARIRVPIAEAEIANTPWPGEMKNLK